MKDGDVIMLPGGTFAMIVELNWPSKGMVRIQKLEENEPVVIDMDRLKSCLSYGCDRYLVAPFLMIRTVHLRLNILSKV